MSMVHSLQGDVQTVSIAQPHDHHELMQLADEGALLFGMNIIKHGK